MAVVISILSIIHFLIFAASLSFLIYIGKKESYQKREYISFSISLLLCGIVGFFVSNQLVFMSDSPSILMTIGYSIVPITPMSLGLLSYPVVNIAFKNLKYTPVVLGIICGAGLSLLLTATVSQFYWKLLGKSIYG